MVKARCPHCNCEVQLGENPQLGQVQICMNCGKRFEVVWLFPLALDYSGDESVEVPQDKLDV